MNRSVRNQMIGKNFPLAAPSHHRRGLSVNGTSNRESFDDPLDLFSRSRRSVSVASSDESDVSVKLGRLSVGSAVVGKNGLEDLLSSAEEGKHDYDWLLTPPGTPLVPTSNGNESQPAQVAPTPRSRALARSVSTTKASRLSVSHSENSHPARPTRSNSVTRPSISSSQYSTYSNKSSNILNTSSTSVSSYIRPSTPTGRTSSSTRPSTPTSRPTLSRPSTPSRTNPSISSASRPSQSSRPSTPSSRPQVPAQLSSPASRSTSRSSTPTRRHSMPSISPASIPSATSVRTVSNGRTVASMSRPSSPARTSVSVSRPSSPGRAPASLSRPSSPGPPVRRTPQPIIPPDFSLETPSNLRTSLPDRPRSAGRSRPGAPASVKGVTEIPNAGNMPRRQPSPSVNRGRLSEPSGRGPMLSNGHVNDVSDSVRSSRASQLTRKPIRTPTDTVGFGGTISKKSLDMAIRHMDIRNGPNGARPLSGSTLFPHSNIRSNGAKIHHQSYGSSSPASLNGSTNSGSVVEKGNYFSRSSENTSDEERYQRPSARVTDVDIYESSRYDMLLLKEDVKNTSWLHSIDDKSDAMFENGFESLPEPFDPLL